MYQHKRSTHTEVEQAKRDTLLQRRMRAEGHKYELMGLYYGFAKDSTEDAKLLVSGWRAMDQRSTIKHTTKGDFSHLHANPLICK